MITINQNSLTYKDIHHSIHRSCPELEYDQILTIVVNLRHFFADEVKESIKNDK